MKLETFMKIIRSFFIIFLLISFSAVFAGGENSESSVIKPRFFCDKLYITTESNITGSYSLMLFDIEGEALAAINFIFTEGEYVLDAKRFKEGIYSYYIKQNDQLIARGSFTKF